MAKPLERLSGPATHICWTPDGTPIQEQFTVVLVRAADLHQLEVQHASLTTYSGAVDKMHTELKQQYTDLLNATADLTDALGSMPADVRQLEQVRFWMANCIVPASCKLKEVVQDGVPL